MIIDFLRTQMLWYRLYDIYNIFVANLQRDLVQAVQISKIHRQSQEGTLFLPM